MKFAKIVFWVAVDLLLGALFLLAFFRTPSQRAATA